MSDFALWALAFAGLVAHLIVGTAVAVAWFRWFDLRFRVYDTDIWVAILFWPVTILFMIIRPVALICCHTVRRAGRV